MTPKPFSPLDMLLTDVINLKPIPVASTCGSKRRGLLAKKYGQGFVCVDWFGKENE